MDETFVPKKLTVIRSPEGVVGRLIGGPGSLPVPSARELGRCILDQVPGNPELLFYDEDVLSFVELIFLKTIGSPQRFLGKINSVRAGIFEVLSAEVPTIMAKQMRLDSVGASDSSKSLRWKSLAAVSPQIAELLPSHGLATLKVKLSNWSGAEPFALHTGPGGVSSPFLAEEHVFCARGGTVSIAPDQSQTPLLGDCLNTMRTIRGLRAVWHAMQGCEALHQSGFVHGDVKPYNIFWTEASIGGLFDFDCALDVQDDSSENTGTLGYIDHLFPGFLDHNPGGRFQNLPAGDVFAFGMTLGDVLNAEADWSWKISTRGLELRECIDKIKPGSYRELILAMTHPKRSERPTLLEATNRLGQLADFGRVPRPRPFSTSFPPAGR